MTHNAQSAMGPEPQALPRQPLPSAAKWRNAIRGWLRSSWVASRFSAYRSRPRHPKLPSVHHGSSRNVTLGSRTVRITHREGQPPWVQF